MQHAPQINPLIAYADAGRKAGIASRRRDASTAEFHSRWCRTALGLEHDEVHRAAARKAFDDAYRAEATPAVALC